MIDEELARFQSGDAQAFRALYERTYPRVYALALRLTADPSAAQELLQDTYVAAWQGIAAFRHESNVLTWLHTITCRLVRRRWRTRLRSREREETSLARGAATARTTPDIAVDLERAIAELPPRVRAALVLHCIHGYSQAETGRMLGIAEGTIKAHIHRARELLGRRLDHEIR